MSVIRATLEDRDAFFLGHRLRQPFRSEGSILERSERVSIFAYFSDQHIGAQDLTVCPLTGRRIAELLQRQPASRQHVLEARIRKEKPQSELGVSDSSF